MHFAFQNSVFDGPIFSAFNASVYCTTKKTHERESHIHAVESADKKGRTFHPVISDRMKSNSKVIHFPIEKSIGKCIEKYIENFSLKNALKNALKNRGFKTNEKSTARRRKIVRAPKIAMRQFPHANL